MSNFYENLLDQLDMSMDASLEARNVLLDKAIRINRQQIFLADKNLNEALLVYSMALDPTESLELFKKIRNRTSSILVNRWKLYYLPKIVSVKLPAKTLNKSKANEYRALTSKKEEYGITTLTNIPGQVKNDSGMIDLSYFLNDLRSVTFDKGMKMQQYMRDLILNELKNKVMEFPNYKNKAIIFKGPFLKNTSIKTSIQPQMLLDKFSPVLWFLEWMYNDIEGFKSWLRENNVSIIFEGVKNQTLVLGRTELSQDLPTFNFKYIIKALHILDGNSEKVEDDEVIATDDDLMKDKLNREESGTGFTTPVQTDDGLNLSDNPPQKVKIIKRSELNKKEENNTQIIIPNNVSIKDIKRPLTLSERMMLNKQNIKEKPEDLVSSKTFDEEKTDEVLQGNDLDDQNNNTNNFDHYIIDEDLPEEETTLYKDNDDGYNEAVDELLEVEESENILPIPHLKKNYFEILENSKAPEEDVAAEILEIHNYTDIKRSVESEEVSAMRRAMNKMYGYSIPEVAELMKSNTLKVKHFNIGNQQTSYSRSTFDALEESYAENLKEKDRENILTHTSNLTYPVFLDEYKVKDITDREFKGVNYEISFITHNGEKLEISLDIPEILENGQLYIGGSKKNITHQDAPKPVIKTDQDVIINTSYNKCFLKFKGKYPGSEMKRLIKTIVEFSKSSPLIKVKTTEELGDFIYANRVSYRMIHLNKHFAGLINKNIDIDFRGIGIVEDEKENTKLAKMFKHDKPFSLLGYINKKPVYHEPETDKISYENKVEDTMVFIANTIKSTDPELWKKCTSARKQTLAGVNSIYCKIMGKDLPVIYVLMIAKPLKEILDIMKQIFGLRYKVIKNDNPVLESDQIKNDYGYGVIRMADYSIVIEYNNPTAEALLVPLVEKDLTNYEVINITNLMKDLVGNSNTQLYIENFVEFFVDPITQRICQYYGIPSDFVGLFLYASSLFTTHKTTYASDSSNFRLITTQELVNRCMYDVIAKELSDNAARMKRASRAKISIPRDAVIRRLQLLPNIAEGNNLSPHRYFALSRSKSYKGHFGTNEERAYKNTTRMFNSNNIGTETGGTAYSANAGITKYLPFNPVIADLSGRYAEVTDPSKLTPSNIFSFVESYVPYLNYDSAPRVIMTNAQFSHVLGVADADPMLVSSYADEAAVFMTPDFSYVAKKDGEIVSINKNFVKIKYNDGVVDVIPLEKTERNSDKGYFTKNDFEVDSKYQVGSKVKEGDLIAYNKYFYKKKLDGAVGLAVGPLVNCLVCDADGVWEDSTLVSQNLSSRLKTYVVKRIARVMDLNSEIRSYETQIGKDVTPNDILFKYKGLSDDAALTAFFGALAEDLNLREVEAHYKGKIVDIRVYYRNAPNRVMSDSIKKFIRDISDIQRITQNMNDLENVTDEFKKVNYSSSPTLLTRGKFSKINGDTIENGQMLVEYYIEIEDKLGPADKIVVSRALKQEPTTVLDDDKMPIGALSGRKCDMIFDTYSCLARMTAGMIMEGTLNAILLHDARKNREILGIAPEKGSILDYYSSEDMIKKDK